MLFTDISGDRAVRAFSKAGFKVIVRSKHIGMSDGERRLTISNHKRLNPYTLKAIIKSSGLTEQQFKDFL